MYRGNEIGKWTPADEYDPSVEDTYLVAWLPDGMKRKQCFIGLVYWDGNEWDKDDIERIAKIAHVKEEIGLYAWARLPEMYRPSEDECCLTMKIEGYKGR